MVEKLEEMTLMAIMTMSSKADRPLADEDIRELARVSGVDPDGLVQQFKDEWNAKQGIGEAPPVSFEAEQFDPPYKR